MEAQKKVAHLPIVPRVNTFGKKCNLYRATRPMQGAALAGDKLVATKTATGGMLWYVMIYPLFFPPGFPPFARVTLYLTDQKN